MQTTHKQPLSLAFHRGSQQSFSTASETAPLGISTRVLAASGHSTNHALATMVIGLQDRYAIYKPGTAGQNMPMQLALKSQKHAASSMHRTNMQCNRPTKTTMLHSQQYSAASGNASMQHQMQAAFSELLSAHSAVAGATVFSLHICIVCLHRWL